eukprot:gene25400-biopygen15211
MFEMLASIAFVILFPYITDRRLAIVMAGALLGFAILILVIGEVQKGWMMRPGHLFAGAMRTSYSFTAGILLARCFSGKPGKYPAILALLLLAGLYFAFWSVRSTGGVWAVVTSIAIMFPAMIVLGAGIELDGWVRRIALWLGYISYPVYVLHQPIYLVLEHLADRHPALVPYATVANLAIMVGTILLASAVPYYWERPVRRLLASLLTAGTLFKMKPTSRPA